MKSMQAIIEDARVALTYCDDFEQSRSVLNGVWRTAFKRGHIKGVKDEMDRPKVTRVITKYISPEGPRPITNASCSKVKP